MSNGEVEGSLLVGADPAVDDVGEASFEASSSFCAGLGRGDLASVVILSWAGVSDLAYGNDMDRGVELPVPAS